MSKAPRRSKSRKAKSPSKRRGRGPHGLSIPEAGAMIGLGRNAAYEAAKAGQIPVMEFGALKIVPRTVWLKQDRRRRRCLKNPKPGPRGPGFLCCLCRRAKRVGYRIARDRYAETYSLIDARLSVPPLGFDHVGLPEIANAIEVTRRQS